MTVQTIRHLQSHKANPVNEALEIAVIDKAGSGGANHHYSITGFSSKTNSSCPFIARYGRPAEHATILFQNGPVDEVGVNGITHEALLAILIDRLDCFQHGPFANEYNAEALDCLHTALAALQTRTAIRTARGVEGTHQI